MTDGNEVDVFGTLATKIRRWRMKTLKPFGRNAQGEFRLSLGDQNPDIARNLALAFDGIDAVEVIEGDLLQLSCDAIVSPANSFGDMGGGIDKAIDDFHRGQAQRRVIDAIAEHFFGELPVGAALIVETDAPRIPFVIAAPTMRVPGNVANSINAYLAMRAALVATLRHNSQKRPPIRTIAVPGLGMGIGGIAFEVGSRQMRAAYDNVVGEKWRQIVHSSQAPFALHENSDSD